MKILIGTTNKGKAREMKEVFGDVFDLVNLTDLKNIPNIEETGKTFEENALLKAKAFFDWSGIPTVADDGGIEIDALGGEPGVKSRRWPGYELIELTFKKMKDIPREKRTASLVAASTFYDGKNSLTFRRSVDGYIIENKPSECELGYPFRALFWIPRFRKIYQDLTLEEHDQINHRIIVYRKLKDAIIGLNL